MDSQFDRIEFEVPSRTRLGDLLVAPVLVSVIVGCLLSIDRPSLVVTLAAVGGVVVFTLLEILMAHSVTPFSWRLVLDARSLWIGWGTRGRSLPYDGVRFVRAVKDKGLARGFESLGRLTIQAGHRTYLIKLRPQDAHAALKALQARCAAAAGVDIDGQSFVASDARYVSASYGRLRRFWLWCPAFGLCAGAIGLAVGAYLVLLPGAEPRLTRLGSIFFVASVIGTGAALFAYVRGLEIVARVERTLPNQGLGQR